MMVDSIVGDVAQNFLSPMLLFFIAGFLIPLLRVEFEFPKALYQALTIVLLLSIGWHGGEKLAELDADRELFYVFGFMVLGFVANTLIGLLAYWLLKKFTPIRKIDAATTGGYYGSDSAGTFAIALGFLTTLNLSYAPYMPVMVAIMEVPGCLVALIIVARLRSQGMDSHGNMPDETDYIKPVADVTSVDIPAMDTTLISDDHNMLNRRKKKLIDGHLLHEVLLNPGIYLLFTGVIIGLLVGLKGKKATEEVGHLFDFEFQGMLCLFIMEMGITACRRIKDLKTAGWQFIAFGLLAPNLFAVIGLLMAYGFSIGLGYPLELGTYVLFMVLCSSSSLIAVPAVQRMAIPEASPTLPLAASLGLTFTYSVTIGIPLYLEIAKLVVGQ
jgi:hypothetical protein